MEKVHVLGAGPGGRKSPVGSRGKSPVGSLGDAKCEISVQFLTFFSAENLGFNEYSSRVWTVYFANTQFKIFF